MLNAVPSDSWLARRDPRVKLAYSATLSLCGVLLSAPPHLAALFGFSLLPWSLVRPPRRHVRALLLMALTATAGMVGSQALFYTGGPRTVLLHLPLGLGLTREGAVYGAGQSLRLLAVLSAGLLPVYCTDATALLLALVRLRLPVPLAWVVSLAWRFLPEALAQGERVLLAQQLRGVTGQGAFAGLRRLRLMLPPLLSGLLRTARQTALAAEARGFSSDRVPLGHLRLTWSDHVVLLALLTLLSVTVASATGWLGAA